MSELERLTGGTLAPGFTAAFVASFEAVVFWAKAELSFFSSGFGVGAGAGTAFSDSSAGGLVVEGTALGAALTAALGAAKGGAGGLPPVLRYCGIRIRRSCFVDGADYLDCWILDDSIFSSCNQRVLFLLCNLLSYLSIAV